MTDKQSTSGKGRRDRSDPVVTRGGKESKAAASSATKQLEGEVMRVVVEKISKKTDVPKQDHAIMPVAELKLCNDLDKLILQEGVKSSVVLKESNPTVENLKEIEKEKESARKEVDEFLEEARILSNTRAQFELLFLALHKACIESVSLLSADEAFRPMEESGKILYEFFMKVEFSTPPPVNLGERHLKFIEALRKLATKLESADPARTAKVTARFHLCTSAYQNKVKWHQNSQNSVKETKKLLQKHFKTSYKRMSLYGQACFHLALHFFSFNQKDSLNSCLKQSFDTFFRRSGGETPSNDSIADLYSLPLEVFNYNSKMLTTYFMKHICSNLMARSQTSLTPSEKIFSLASRIWISDLLDTSNTKMFRKDQKAFSNLDFSIPPREQIHAMTDVLLKVIESDLLLNEMDFRKKLFSFVKSLCLLNEHLYYKFNFFYHLVLAIITIEDYSKDTDFYLELCTCFTSEIEKLTLSPDCDWMYKMLASAHLAFCYFLAEVADYDKCLHHAKRAIRVIAIASYKVNKRADIILLRSRAFYICVFSYYKKKDHYLAKLCLNREIAFLEMIKSQYPDTLHAAKKHKAFLERGDASEPVPAGLNKLFKVPPESSDY